MASSKRQELQILVRRPLFAAAALAFLTVAPARAQAAPDPGAAPSHPPAPVVRETAPDGPTALPPDTGPAAAYDKAVIRTPVPASSLTFLAPYDGAQSRQLWHDKQFRSLLKQTMPRWEFHFGIDMSIMDALEYALADSHDSVTLRDGRYLAASGRSGMYPGLQGRGFVWADLKDGLLLGAFYFHPTNGEPTPTLTVFSRQIQEPALTLGQLPPAFAEDLRRWQQQARLPELETRYFIGGMDERVLLEHDEDFCAYLPGVQGPPSGDCRQQDLDAADLDLDTANYLEQVHHATNATAWMITGADQTAFLTYRSRTCGTGLACSIRLTRTRVHDVTRRR